MSSNGWRGGAGGHRAGQASQNLLAPLPSVSLSDYARLKTVATFDPFAQLVEGVHRAGLAQFDLGLGILQGSCRAKGLLQSQHDLIHLQREF